MATTLLEQRRAQMFPKLTSAQLARLERQGTRMQTRAGSVKRIASAVGEGSICVQFVHRVLRELDDAGNLRAFAAA